MQLVSDISILLQKPWLAEMSKCSDTKTWQQLASFGQWQQDSHKHQASLQSDLEKRGLKQQLAWNA